MDPSYFSSLTSNLQNILKNMGGIAGPRQSHGPPLSSVMDDKLVTKILVEDREAQDRLFPHLPERDRNLEGIKELATSPQFLQSLDMFHHALAKGHLHSIALQCGLDPNSLPQKESMLESFFAGLEAKYGKKEEMDEETRKALEMSLRKDDMEDDDMDEETRKAIEMSLRDEEEQKN